jgi:hypothetical protein
MPDYSNGKIYTIRNRNDDTKIYVGSTIQSLAVRFAGHKRDSQRYMKYKLYVEVHNDWDNWYIELYENYQCNNREELHKREGEIIRLIGTLNMVIAGRDKTQYRIENSDKMKEYQKQYRIENVERIKEEKQQYYMENTDKIKEYKKQYYIENINNIKEKDKQYREENAEKIKEKNKKYYLENAEKIKEQKKQYYLKNKLNKT